MEDPERSTLSSLDLYSDMIGETEERTGEMDEMSEGGRGQADLYSDMLGETEEMSEGGRGQAHLYSDMIEETEGMSEEGRGQMDLYSDMLGETEEMSERGRGQVEEHSVMSSMDLYEDIIEEERENEKFEELRSEVTKTAGQMEDLMAQMEHVQTEKQSLAAENRALKKNISVLFVTAKSELDRKQKEIAQLRADLDMLRMRRGAPRIPHSTRPFDNRSDHSRPGPSGRESTITREASSTHRDVADRQPGNYRQNYQQGESPERDSRREGAGISKSHPEQRNFRSSKSPEKDQDRRDGTRDRTCHFKHTKSDLKSRETKQQTVDKTDRSAGEGSTPRQASQDRDKLKIKDTEEIKDGKTEEHDQERSKSAGERTGPHTPTYPYPDSEQEAIVGQACLKEPVPEGPKTPPEPYPYEDAAHSSKLMNDSERHHKQEGGRHKIPGDEKNRKHSKERQKDSAYHSSGSKSLCGREHSLEDRREEHKQEGYRNKMAGHDEGRGHSVEGKKDSAYCSSGSESLGRHSRESSSEKKREEYEKDKRREDSRLDSKTRKGTRHASREKHQKEGRNSNEKSLERNREELEPDRRRENNISSGDLRQKLTQNKHSRDKSKEKSSDDSKKGDHDKRKTVEQKEHNSRKSKESRHGKEPSSRIAERGRERHRDEGRSTERDRSNSRLQREGRKKGDKSERSQLPGDTREAQKRKRSSSGEHKHLKERRKVSPPRKKQYEKGRDGHDKSRERKQSSSRHKDRSEGRNKERSRRRSSERSNSLHDYSKEPDRRGHRSKFVNYRDRSEDRDSDPDSRRSLSVETDSSSGSSSAGSSAALNDGEKHLPTSFEGSLHSSRSREAGQQDRVAALTSPVRGSSFNEEPTETDTVEEGTDAVDKQDTALKSQTHYKDGDKLKEKTDHPTSPYRIKSDREKTIHNSPDCATEAGSSQQPVTTCHQLQEKHDESEMEEEVTSTTTEQPDRGADVRVRVDSDSCAEELGSILAPVKRKREDTKQGHITPPAAKKKKAAQNTPTKKGSPSPRKNAKRSPSKKVTCSPKKSPQKIAQKVAESEVTPNTPVSPQKTPKKLVKSPQTSPKKVTLSPHDTSTKKVFKSPQKTPKKSSATPKKKSKSPRKTENLVEKCRSIVWTGKSAKGKTVNLFHIEYETAENAAREVFRNSPLLSPVKPPTPQLNLSARSSDLELPSGEESCSLPLPAISAQLKTDKRDMEQPIPSYHGSLSFSSFHDNKNTNVKSFDGTEKANQQQKEQSLKSGTSSQLPFVPSEDTSRSGGSSLEEQDFPQTVVPFSGASEVSETIEPVSALLPTKEVKQQANSESTGPFEVSINAESVTPDSDLKGNIQTQDGHTSPQKGREEKDDDVTSTEDNTAEDDEKATVEEEREELPLKTDEELRRSVETSLLSISNEFDSSTANLSNEELFAVEVLAQLAAAAKTPSHSPVKPAFSLQQASPRKGGTGNCSAKKSLMKVAVTGSTPYRLFSPGRLEPTIAAEVEVGSGCTPKKGSRQRKSAMDSPFIPPQPSAFDSKKEKTYKKSTDSKKAAEKKKRDRKGSKQSAEVLPEQVTEANKTKGDKVPPLEVRPLRCSPRKPQGKTAADAARLPRKSPRKMSTVTPVKSREEAAVVTDLSQQKNKDSLQENQKLTRDIHKEARETSTTLSVARSSDHNTASASYCVWQTRQTPERERESRTDLEQNSCPDRLPHDDLEDMPNMIVLSPKSNGFQTRLMKKNVTQSETSAHNRSEAKKPSLATKSIVTNNTQISSSSLETTQIGAKSNERDLLTVPTSSQKCASTDQQQTDCSNKDSPGTDSIGQTSPKVHDVQNTKETVPNDSLSKGIQKQPEQMVTTTRPGTDPAPNQTTEYNSTDTLARQGGEGDRVDLSASKGDSKVVQEVEPMQTGETTESHAAEENQAPLGDHKTGRSEKSQTPLSQQKQEINTEKSTLGEEELDVAVEHGAQTSAKPQPQTSLSPDTDVEEEIEEGECTSSDEEEEEIDTTVLLPCSTSEENAAHNSIETAASFNSDTSLPRPSTPTGLRQEMTLDQFSVLDPDDLRCQSAMSIDVRLIPSTPSGKMGPPSRGATPSGKDAAPTPGKSNPALPKTPAEKRQSGAFRQLFNSPPGGRFASTPAAERPKPPRFQLDMSVIGTAKEEDSQCMGTPVVADKTRQDIRDTSRKAATVTQSETVDIAVQGSSKLHTKDLKHLETDKMHRQTEKERKTSGEMKTRTSSGSGRVNTTIASSPKLAPPRRLPSKTDAFKKHLADENLKKETEEAKKQKEESHKKIKSVRTPEKNMKRKDLDPSDFFPDVSSDEDDVSDSLGDQEEEPMEVPVPLTESKASLTGKETIAHVEEVSSVRKQLLSSKASWQQQAEETAKRNSVDMPSASPSVAEDMPSASPSVTVDMPSASPSVTVDMPSASASVTVDMPSASPSAKVSLSPTSSINQPMKQINSNSPAATVHQKDPTQGAHWSDRQASITFGKAVPGKDKASNNSTVTDTAMVEAGSSTTAKGRSTGVCSVQSETGPAACHKQDAVPNTVDTSTGLSGTEAPMSASLSPDQTPSLTDPPSLPMPSGVLPSAHADIQTLPNQLQHSLCAVNNPHGSVAFQQPLSKEQPSTLPLHNISPEPCVQKSVIPTPLPSQVENVAVQGTMPANSSADGIFRVPLPPMNREPPPQPADVSQPTPPVYVAERPVIKLNKFSYAAICALEANYGYEWLWPVKPQPQESLPAKQEPDFLSSTTGSQETKLFVTTCESNVAAHQPSPLHSQPFSASTQILQPVTGGESQTFSALTSSVAFGNQNHRNTRTGRDRSSGVVTSKVEGKTVKELLSKSRKQQGKVHQQTGLAAGVEPMNTGRNHQVLSGVPQAAVPPVTGVFLQGVSQTQGVSQVTGVPQVTGMSHMTGVSQVPGVVPSTVGNTSQVLYSANRNIFDALSGERLGISNTPVGPPVTGTPVLTSQLENTCTRTGPTVVITPTSNQQKLKQGTPCTTSKDVPPHTRTPDSKTCNKRITSPNPDIWYQAFGSPKAAAQNTEMFETQKTTAHKEKGTGEPKAVVKKCLEENHQEVGEGDLSEGEIVSDDEDATIVKSSGTSSYRDSHYREKPSTGTSKRNEGSSARHNNSQHSEQRVKDDRNSHRSRGQKASDMKRDRKHTEHSRHGSRRPTSEEVRLREQNYKEGWGRGDRGRTEHGRGDKVSRDRAPASWEGEQVSRKANKGERKARR